MKTLFGVRNSTGETWPAYAMARLGPVLVRDGVNSDLPVYTLVKPDGADGVYVVNGASPLGFTSPNNEGTATHYLDAQRVLVSSGLTVAIGDTIGAVSGQWEAGLGWHFNALDAKNSRNVVTVTNYRNEPFWAVNIGSCAAPSLSVSSGVITGFTTGTAALLKGFLEVTSGRATYTRADDGGTIADGTMIQLMFVSGKLSSVYANCGPTTGLTGLPEVPE